MSINVDFNSSTNNIVVTTQNGQIITKNPIDFYALGINEPPTPCLLNTDNAKFEQEQRDLRILDCMKDAKIDTNISNNVPGIFGAGNGIFGPVNYMGYTFEKLHELEDKFINCFKSKIKKFAWTKVSKDSSLEPKFSKRIIFKESGLDAEYFVRDPIFCGNFANEIIDPAGRSSIRSGSTDIVFPINNVTLTITKAFLTLFGLPECESINATRRGNNNYIYSININEISTPITSATTTEAGQSVSWFAGNSVKNSFINNTPGLSTEIKKAILICKELGDLLQVLIMLVWVISTSGTQYSMVTCDKVVYLMCMILNLNCILTYASLEDGKKLRTIDYFEPTGYTIEHATARFNTEKVAIIDENQKFISALASLMNSQQHVLIPGTIPITFSSLFYTDIIYDLTLINDRLRGFIVPNSIYTDVIDSALKDMKENFLFVMFIRRVGRDFKMLFAKTYTKKNTLWNVATLPPLIPLPPLRLSLIGYNTKLLYNIGKDYTTSKKRQRGGKRYIGGTTPIENENNGAPAPIENENNGPGPIENENIGAPGPAPGPGPGPGPAPAPVDPFSVLDYPNTDLEYIDEEGNKYKPYEILISSINSRLRSINSQLRIINSIDKYETVYNELLYEFYYINEVMYDDPLERLIYNIILHINSDILQDNSPVFFIPIANNQGPYILNSPSYKKIRVGGNIKNTTAKNKTTRSNKHKR